MKPLFLFCFLLFILPVYIAAQNALDGQQNFETLVESIIENSENELDLNDLLDDLRYYYEHPLDLNTATTMELEKLSFLTDFQIFSLIDYRDKHGELVTIYELKFIFGFDRTTIEKMLPFVTVGARSKNDKLTFNNAIHHGKNQLFLRTQSTLEKSQGYKGSNDSLSTTDYPGSPLKVYTRYSYRFNEQLRFGFTAEKDPGESFFGGTNKQGFDYYSAHLLFHDLGRVKTLAIGDYQLKFGQGLTLWSGLSFGKSIHHLSQKRFARGIEKYSGSDENRYMRGVASTVSLGNFEITGFFSRKKIDGNIAEYDTLNNEPLEFSSFGSSGYHRTLNELEDENAISEQISGGNLTFKQNHWKVGLCMVHYLYSTKYNKGEEAYNTFVFSGKENMNVGIDYLVYLKKTTLYGEITSDIDGNTGYLSGLDHALHSRVHLSLFYREYSKAFCNFYGNAAGENNINNNEKGFYTGLSIHLLSNLNFSGYFDNYKFDWLKYRSSAPSLGFEYQLQLEYIPSSHVNMHLRYISESKEIDKQAETSPDFLSDMTKSRIRYHINYSLSEQLKLRNRVVFSFYEGENKTNGYMVFQDVVYSFKKPEINLAFRYTFFETPEYETRIYTYENDLLYSFSMPAYYGKGSRTYLLIRYSPSYHLDFWIKYGITLYTDRNKIGTGADEIDSNRKSEVRLQIRWRF